jgi:hypothetical protein
VTDEAFESPVVSSVAFAVAWSETPGVGAAIAVAGKTTQARSTSKQTQRSLGRVRALGAGTVDVSRDAAIGRVRGPDNPMPLSARRPANLRNARSAPTTSYQDDRYSS